MIKSKRATSTTLCDAFSKLSDYSWRTSFAIVCLVNFHISGSDSISGFTAAVANYAQYMEDEVEPAQSSNWNA